MLGISENDMTVERKVSGLAKYDSLVTTAVCSSFECENEIPCCYLLASDHAYTRFVFNMIMRQVLSSGLPRARGNHSPQDKLFMSIHLI